MQAKIAQQGEQRVGASKCFAHNPVKLFFFFLANGNSRYEVDLKTFF